MKSIMTALSAPLASESWKRKVLPPEIASSSDIASALRVIRGRWPEPILDSQADDAPVFLLSASWGAGSTLLQRLIMSDKRTMLWGEPFDHAIPVCRMAQMIMPVTDRWPRDRYFEPLDDKLSLEYQWVANLTPPVESLRQAHRAFFRDWLQHSAARLGRDRWGFKEVRLAGEHALYLQWLFPKARFVFVYRDVLASWRSCQNVKWYSVWPQYRVARASAFAHHWCHILSSFLDVRDQVNALVVRYEDLAKGNLDLDVLATHLDVTSLDRGVLDVRVGERGGKTREVSKLDEAIIRRISDPLRDRVGYAT